MSAAIVLTLVVSACNTSSGAQPSHQDATLGTAARFLDRYVTSDGRVLRPDQGGDIVSEGQAYGILLAEVAGRDRTARTIWAWTSSHLHRPDGLLAYHADASGRVIDDNPATDADVLCAYALLRYRGQDQTSLRAAGRRLAQAVLASESTMVGGSPVPVAGTWATAAPQTVNPSYWMPSVFTALGRFTGDSRWEHAAQETVRLLALLTGQGQRLPPDWARLTAGQLTSIGAPDGTAPVQYGLDAARLPVWLGTACSADARKLAAGWWTDRLSQVNDLASVSLSLTGEPVNPAPHPLPLMAAATAARSAGDESRSAALSGQAAELSRRTPTYYGVAWVALAGALLDGSLDPCRDS